jgi:hypothetical protein
LTGYPSCPAADNRRKMKRNFFAILLLVTFVFQAAAVAQAPIKISPAERKAVEGVTARQLSDYLHFVASDEMEGRDTPSRGLDLTAKFIALNLSRWGFKPAGDDGTFFQKIALSREVVDPAATSVSLGGQKFNYGTDFVRALGSSKAPLTGPVIFVGNGWMVRSKNINPYANVDVRGKFIAVFSEGQPGGRFIVPMPQGVSQADLTGVRGTDWADAVAYAEANGAAGVILLPSKFLAENWDFVTRLYGRVRLVVDKLRREPDASAGTPTSNIPNIFVASTELAKALFAGEQGDPFSGHTASFELNPAKTLNVQIATTNDVQWTQNVVGIWEGSDPVLKNEMVAIGSHYDHDGVRPNAPGPDKIWNGADDDGSGTVAMIAIAEALAKMPSRPKRSVLFVWHTGEEKGLWGSEYFNKFPTVDIKNVIAQLNIDMIGRSRKPGDTNPRNKDLTDENSVYLIGSEVMSSPLGAVTKGTNAAFLNLNYDYKYDAPNDPNRFFFRSDHYHYAVNGIPIAFWFTGVHEDYHGAGDHPDKIDYVKMEKITRTIMMTMLKLAELKDRPKIDKKLPPELAGQN